MKTKSNRVVSRKSKLLKIAKKWARPVGVMLLAAVLGWGGTAVGQEIYWDNPGIGNWNDAGNWDPARLPGTSDNVFIDNGGTAIIGRGVEGEANLLIVGYSGTGVLNLTGGGKATSASVITIGDEKGSNGTVNVGAGSVLENTEYTLIVGWKGTGVLNLTGGGKAISTSGIFIGSIETGCGTVTVNGAGSILEAGGYLYVGDSGTGVLNLTGGGKATSARDINIGINGTGTVNVGAGSVLENTSGTLTVGYFGTAVLNLTGGGMATSAGDINIGRENGSNGTVMVGEGSSLESTGSIYVGGSYGGRGMLAGTGTVIAGGQDGVKVWSGGTLSAGDKPGAIGTLTIDSNLDLQSGATIQFDYKGDTHDRIAVTGSTNIEGRVVVPLSSLMGDDITTPRTILTAKDGITGTPEGWLFLNGSSIAGSRIGTSSVTLGVGGNELQITDLTLDYYENKAIDWNGGNGQWNLRAENWVDHDPPNAATQFLDGDIVYFTTDGVTDNTRVDIEGSRKVVGDLYVQHETYNLTLNGNIVADKDESTLGTATGKLYKSDTGMLTLNGDNEFTGGVEMIAGTLVLGHDRSLGTWSAGERVAASGGVLVTDGASTIEVTEDRTITNHFNCTFQITPPAGAVFPAGELFFAR